MAGRTFSGNVRIAKINGDGVVQGAFIGLLNTIKCELVVPAPEKIQQISRMNGTVGQPISTALIPKPTSLAMSIDDTSDQRILAYALNGITAAYAQAANTIAVQAGSTVTDEADSATTLGTPIQLAKHHVSSVVVKHTSGSPTYVVNVDYTVNANLGTVTPLVGGAITGSQALKISYIAATTTAETVTAPAVFGDWAPLANRHVNGFVLKNSGATVTYTAGTDYVLDATAGFVRIVAGGLIAAGDSLRASYSAAAITGTTVQGSTVAATLLRIEVNLTDLVDGSEGYFIAPIYNANSSGNQDLFGKNMLVAGLTGDMFLPPQGTAAYTETGGAPYILTSISG